MPLHDMTRDFVLLAEQVIRRGEADDKPTKLMEMTSLFGRTGIIPGTCLLRSLATAPFRPRQSF